MLPRSSRHSAESAALSESDATSAGSSAADFDVTGRRIFSLAFPALGVLAAEPLYLLFDIAVVGRLGYADHDVNPVRCFWSLGVQYQGLLPSRDDDVLAVGVARGELTESAGFTETNETVTEVYYNAAVTGWLSVSPSVQYIVNPGGVHTPGGVNDARDAAVFALRLQMAF